MSGEDINRVLEIERASFTQPYSRELFEEELSLDIAFPKIVKSGSIIIGFMDYWIVKDELHLINIAVDPPYRRLHIGTFLMKHLMEEGRQKGASKILLDVRGSNLAAIRLYEKFEFKKIGVRQRYYTDNGEDAWVMVRDL